MGLDFNDAPEQAPERVYTPANDRAEFDRRVAGLREALRRSADTVFRALFPHGDTTAREGRIGNVAGEHGESLKVDFLGDGAGLWRDHATGEGGDLLSLFQAFHGCSFPEAVEGLEGLVGVSYAEPSREWVRRTRERATVQQAAAGPKPRKVRAAHWDYLSADGSRVLARVIRLDKFHALTGAPCGKTFMLATLKADGSEDYAGPDVRPLYNLPGIASADVVALVEGEKCADRLIALGVPATCIIGGANADLDKVDWAPLRGKRLIQWGDLDAVGAEFVRRVQARLVGTPCAPVVVPEAWAKPEKWDAADATDEEARELLGAAYRILEAMPAPANLPGSRFRFTSIDELLDASPVEWRIEGVFPTHGLSVLYGSYETFKTFVALDMTLSLAVGQSWQGRAVRPCPVVYVAGEGQRGVGGRVAGWLQHYGYSREAVRGRFEVLGEAVAIPNANDLSELVALIKTMPEPPGVIVLDTLTRMTGGGSLNNEQDMQAYVAGVEALKRATGAHVMSIGHAGKNRENGLLGSIVVPAAMETIICVERAGAERAVSLINSHPKGKQKEGEAFPDIALMLVAAPFEHRGVAHSSLVPLLDVTRAAENGPAAGDKAPTLASLPGDAERVLEALRRAPVGMGFNTLLSHLWPGQEKARKSTLNRCLGALRTRGDVERVEGEEGKPTKWFACHGEPGDDG